MQHRNPESLPRPGGDVRKVTVPDQSSPTREEFNRVLQTLDELIAQVAAANRELAIQFERMAQIQADLDLLRAGMAKPTQTDTE